MAPTILLYKRHSNYIKTSNRQKAVFCVFQLLKRLRESYGGKIFLLKSVLNGRWQTTSDLNVCCPLPKWRSVCTSSNTFPLYDKTKKQTKEILKWQLLLKIISPFNGCGRTFENPNSLERQSRSDGMREI